MPPRKKSKTDELSSPGTSSRGRPHREIQVRLAEYNCPGFIADHWWDSPLPDSTWDLAAGICWEVLRRHPDGRGLKKIGEAVEDELQLDLDHHSTRPANPCPIRPLQYEIDRVYGQEVLDAIRCFSSLSSQDFASLHTRDGARGGSKPISPWLLNYRSLWKVLDEEERVPASSIELRDPMMSERNPKGRSCMNLVRPAPSCEAPSGSPPVEGYDPEPVLGIGMWAYCDTPADSGCPSGRDNRFPDNPDPDSRHHTDLRLAIRYSHLESELTKLGMRPLVLAVRIDAPKKEILREIGKILDGLQPQMSRSKPRKFEDRTFDVLKQLDREVVTGKAEVVSFGTTKVFLRSAALKPDKFVSFCRDHLARRREFFEQIGFSGFEGRASGTVSF